jgi:hypothetical protein
MIVDLKSKRFGSLIAIAYVKGGDGAKWECLCDCGNLVTRTADYLKRMTHPSCGCQRHRFAKENSKTHGMSYTKEYRAWVGMKTRCSSDEPELIESYKNRGITVCPEWEDNFEAFYAHIGPSPSGVHTVDRINNDLGYQPGNVRWATMKVQGLNKSDNIWVKINGVRVRLFDECERRGFSRLHKKCVYWRIKTGWGTIEALTTPIQHRSENRRG